MGLKSIWQSIVGKAPASSSRLDGWENPYMGYGTWRDKTTYGTHHLSALLHDEVISSLFYTDDIAAKIVEKRPEEAFRRGYTIADREDQKRAEELRRKATELDVDVKFQEAWTWARCFGGSVVIIGAEGGQSSTPLDPANARDVRFLNVLDRRFVTVESTYKDPFEPNYGQPEMYLVMGANGSVSRIHESRTIRFEGVRTDIRKRIELAGWGYSVLQRPYEVIRQFATSFAAAGVLTADASQAVFKMKGLMQMIASGEKERLQTRMQLVDMSRSAARAVLLDTDGEEFNRIATSFQGLPEMLDRFAMRLAASIDMPVTLLMGRSPAGENATGASDFKHWYDSIASEQAKSMTPKLLRLYNILARGAAPNLSIKWLPLQEPTEKERAEIDKIKTDTRSVEIRDGVLFAEEVALAKYGKNSNGEIEIDENVRRKSLESEKELALNPPPESPTPLGGRPEGGPAPSTETSATGAVP